jgi:hypothetical protein
MLFLRFERRHLYKENGGSIDSVQTSMSIDLCSRKEFEAEVSGAGRKRRLWSSLKEINMARPFRIRSTRILSSNMSLREGSSPCLQCQSWMVAMSRSFCFCRIDLGTMV